MLSQVSTRPSDPSIVVETEDLTLVWNYVLGGAITFGQFANVTDGSVPIASRTAQDESLSVEQPYQDRFTADITTTQARLRIREVQVSDQGKYQFFLSASNSANIQEEVEVIVHCK